MAIRLVAVDVDGTLVTADQRVLPRVQAAAQRALEHGIQLVLCTGRAPGECWYILDALPQIRYAVTQTGAIAQDLKTGETLYHCPLSPDDARLIYSHVRRYDGLVNFFSGGIVYNSKEQMARFAAQCVTVGKRVRLVRGDTACEAVVDWHGSMVSLSVSGGSGARTLLQALLDGME